MNIVYFLTHGNHVYFEHNLDGQGIYVYLNIWKLWLITFKILVNCVQWMTYELCYLVVFINRQLNVINRIFEEYYY
jgi:hypothetical protein